jgi:hypothetical protein
MVADPGEYGTFTYTWTATSGGQTIKQTTTGPTFDFTMSEPDAYTVSLSVEDADGQVWSAQQSVTVPAEDFGDYGSSGTTYTYFPADHPTVTIEQCDEYENPDDSAVQPGSDAYFLISPSLNEPLPNPPNDAPITVYYKTQDGSPDGYTPDGVAQADVDYTFTAGSLTFTWDRNANGGHGGYDSQKVPVPTSATSNGGDFSMDITSLYDPCASTIGNVPGTLVAFATATVAAPSLEVVATALGGTDSNDINVTTTPMTVDIGQSLNIWVAGADANATVKWKVPATADFVGGVDAGTPGGPEAGKPTTSPPLPGRPQNPPKDNEIDGAWVHAGKQTLDVDVTINGKTTTLTANFIVKSPTNLLVRGTPFSGGAPTVYGTGSGTTLQNYPSKGAPRRMWAEFGSELPGPRVPPPRPGTTAGMSFTVVSGLPSGWEYTWEQIAEVGGRVWNQTGNSRLAWNSGSDGPFGFGTPINQPTYDSPGMSVLPGDTLSTFGVFATIWLMVKPNFEGIWVPVADLSWFWTVAVTYPSGANSTAELSASLPDPHTPTNFTATSKYPKWTRLVSYDLKPVR